MAGHALGQRFTKRQPDVALTFVKADTEEKEAAVGNQTAGHVYLFIETDDLIRDYTEMSAKSVTFIKRPEDHPWAKPQPYSTYTATS